MLERTSVAYGKAPSLFVLLLSAPNWCNGANICADAQIESKARLETRAIAAQRSMRQVFKGNVRDFIKPHGARPGKSNCPPAIVTGTPTNGLSVDGAASLPLELVRMVRTADHPILGVNYTHKA